MERFRQKVASSSSRVIASLQQVAAGSGALAGSGSGVGGGSQFPHQHRLAPGRQQQATLPQARVVPRAAMSTSWLVAARNTGHLTDEERGVLLEVFKKEEQFQRDTIKLLTVPQQQQLLQQQQLELNKQNQLNDSARDRSRDQMGNVQQRPFSSGSTASNVLATPQTTPAGSRPTSSALNTRPTTTNSDELTTIEDRVENSSREALARKQQQPPPPPPQRQCRICRKQLYTGSGLLSEPVHLCSNCKQLICDDCASYSSNDQHWMCSSCRRRAMNPPIPNDALKDLGLKNDTSAVRRMALRIEQAGLKSAVNKSSSESTTSSNSSSGCSSMSIHATAAAAAAVAASLAANASTTCTTNAQVTALLHQASIASRTNLMREQLAAARQKHSAQMQRQPSPQVGSLASQDERALVAARASSRQAHAANQAAGSQSSPAKSVKVARGQARSSGQVSQQSYCELRAERQGAQKTMSHPTANLSAGSSPHHSVVQPLSSVDSAKLQHQQQQQRSSKTLKQHDQSWTGGMPETKRAATLRLQQQHSLSLSGNESRAVVRRASAVGEIRQQQPVGRRASQLSALMRTDSGNQQAQLGRKLGDGQHRNSVCSLEPGQHQAPSYGYQQQGAEPQSNLSLYGHVEGSYQSCARQPHQHQQQQQQLIPFPSEQMHLRRASDESNMVRRLSNAALDGQLGVLVARNRSHSNIDSVANYFTSSLNAPRLGQPPAGGQKRGAQHYAVSDEHINRQQQQQHYQQLHLPQLQQRRLSDQWDERQRSLLSQQQQQRQLGAGGVPALSSIITSCSQKRRSSDELFHSGDSTSGDELADQAPAYYCQQPISIPSVSVSEFTHRRSSLALQQLQLQQQQQQQQQQKQHQQLAYATDQIDPVQINLATEQAIQQQQLQEQLQQRQQRHQQQLFAHFLPIRRGSGGGRMLPCVPGCSEQSRSLLELPASGASAVHGGPALNLVGSASPASGHACSTLDLPSAGPTIRRASAPEGQNIKIVVDDIDGGAHLHGHHHHFGQHSAHSTPQCSGSVGAHAHSGQANGQVHKRVSHYHSGAKARATPAGEIYERHILHRDDSLALDCKGAAAACADDNHASATTTNQVGREFGLQVMGGKLNQLDSKLRACITWVLPGGPADKRGLRPGDQIIEWDGKCLLDMSYEQVAEVIEASANVAELIVKPQLQVLEPGANYVRSQRRLSQQTERDLRLLHEQQHQQQLTSLLSALGSVQQPQQQQQQQQQQMLSDQRRQALQQASETTRTGRGRKLPKIPVGAASAAGQHQSQPPFNPLRHASTGQLEHTGLAHVDSRELRLVGYVTPQTGEFRATTGKHLLSAASNTPQQQSRSAGELHRESVNSLLSTHSAREYQHHQQQQHQSMLMQQQLAVGGSADVAPQHQQHQLPHQQHHLHQQWPVSQQVPYYGGSQIIGGYQQRAQVGAYPHWPDTNANDYARSLAGDRPCGLIGLQVSVDERAATLDISVLSAHNIDRNPSLDYYVRLRLLPESNQFKPRSTHPSADMNWKETFLFQNIPVAQVHRMAIEIGIWVYDEAPRLSANVAQPICEALIPIQSARERSIDFWPLRPPPSSPQTRRKSLNDLMANHYQPVQQTPHYTGDLAAAPQVRSNELASARLSAAAAIRYSRAPSSSQSAVAGQAMQFSPSRQRYPSESGRRQSASTRMSPNDSPQRQTSAMLDYQRERSASNRNLPDTSRLLQVQPRRASDELAAASSSHRLLTGLSPTASRRSISVMNVGDGHLQGGPRRGSQTSVIRAQIRRDSVARFAADTQQQHHHPHQQQPASGSGRASPIAKHGSPGGNFRPCTEQQQVGLTPARRRSSLAGIQSMSGFRSQRNSQSDTTDNTNDSPLNSAAHQAKWAREPPVVFAVQQAAVAPNAGSSTRQSNSSNAGSRRGSVSAAAAAAAIAHGEQTTTAHQHAPLQRRGSFAMQTLRKLKRTMSLTKGNDNSQPGSNHDSRRVSSSSSSSDRFEAEHELADEDLAVARTAKTGNVKGRLLLSFSLSKGQFEVEVISAQDLKFDHESAVGIYVKMYLRGRNKTIKKKTRLVSPWDSTMFKQTIKYDGSSVDNKLLEISVWAKLGSLRGKVPIGLTEIRLNDLNLDGSQLQTTSWYNLRSVDSLCSSSVED